MLTIIKDAKYTYRQKSDALEILFKFNMSKFLNYLTDYHEPFFIVKNDSLGTSCSP